MKTQITDYPSSYLMVELSNSEQIITEKGTLIYATGQYAFKSKIEVQSYKNWIAKVFGKSLSYGVYTAKENGARLAFAPKHNAEVFEVEVSEENPVLFEPELHFARSQSLKLHLKGQGLKMTFIDGLKLQTEGAGKLFLKGHGQIVKQELNTEVPAYIDEDALIAYESSLSVKGVSRSMKETVLSGEGYLLEVKGKGAVWMQTRQKAEQSGGGGLLDGVFQLFG